MNDTAYDAGCDGFISKPFSMIGLLEMMHRLLLR